jgi:hypothetical protein
MSLSLKTSRILSGSQTGEFIGFLHRRSHLNLGFRLSALKNSLRSSDGGMAGSVATPNH